jgi:hypothetical protein
VNSTSRAALALATLLAAGACSPEGDDAGDVDVAVDVAVDPAPLGGGATIPVAAVWVHVWGTPQPKISLDLWVLATRTWTGYSAQLQKLPAGPYRVEAKAFSVAPRGAAAARTTPADFLSPAPLAVTVGGGLQRVSLVLQQNAALHPPGRVGNAAPSIAGIVASTVALDGVTPPVAVQLAAVATDADGDPLTWRWTVTYAPAPASPGTFSAPAAAKTTFVPPAPYEGVITLAAAATDPQGATSTSAVDVTASMSSGKGVLLVIASVNHWPNVGPITTAGAQPAPGTTIALAVTATDPDGEALTWSWSDGGCGGSFGTPAARTTTWRAPASERACTVAATARDPRGGSSTSTLVVNVQRPAAAFAPEFLFASQAPSNPVPPGGPVTFSVDVAQPTPTPGVWLPITEPLAWAASAGAAPAATGPRDAAWTAPGCGGANAPLSVEITVTATGTSLPGGGPNASTFRFPVTVACP